MRRGDTQIEADSALQLLTILQEELVSSLGQVGKIMIDYSDGSPVEQVAMGSLCLAYQSMAGMKQALEKVVPKAGEESWRSLSVAHIHSSDCNCGCTAGCAWEKA